MDLIDIIGQAVYASDEAARRIADAFLGLNEQLSDAKELFDLTDDRIDLLNRQREEGRGLGNALKQKEPLLASLVFCRSVEDFETYVAALLALIFQKRPETLKSSRTVRLETVLSYSTMTDFIGAEAERRVQEMSYLGLDRLSEDLEESLGFGLFTSAEDLTRAVRITATRNLLVHNRGIVNRVFLSRVKDTPRKLGDKISLELNQALEEAVFLINHAWDIDKRAREKFNLDVAKFVAS
ncbi:MAG: hypothetical protein HW388_877 [Dehalococcoidia bacterium]|nr:hypothetical protein [Dehalococcoidia bacterium]